MKKKQWYCLKGGGRLWPRTLGDTKQDAWFNSFDFVSGCIGNDFGVKYWKRLRASQEAAKRRGWVIVPVEVTEVKQ